MNRFIAQSLLAMVATVCLPPACAQETPNRKLVEIKYLRGERLRNAIELVNKFLQPSGDAVYTADLNVVLLRQLGNFGDPLIPAAEALLKRFDVPGAAEPARVQPQNPQVQLRVYLIEASSEEGKGASVPSEISGAVEQMRKSFQYRSYRLMDTMVMQLQPRGGGTAEASGALAGGGQHRTTYTLRCSPVELGTDGKMIGFRPFQMNLRIPVVTENPVGSPMLTSVSYVDSMLKSDLTLREGQKLVVGKVSHEKATSSIFLILAADFS